MVQFDISVMPNVPLKELVQNAQLADHYGFSCLWVADELPVPNFRHPWPALTTILHETENISVATGIAIPYHDHPVILANYVATLQEAYGDRILLGIGPGGTQPLRPLGIKVWEKPLTAMRETIQIIKMLWEGQISEFHGKMFTADQIQLSPTPEFPLEIFLAARGPLMLQLAGSHADGALVQVPASCLSDAIRQIEIGLKNGSRDRKQVNIGNLINMSVSNTSPVEATNLARLKLSWMIPDTPRTIWENIGIIQEEVDNLREALKQGSSAAQELVTSKMVEGYAVTGTSKQCLEKLDAYLQSGLDRIVFGSPLGPNPRDAIRLIGEEILPSL